MIILFDHVLSNAVMYLSMFSDVASDQQVLLLLNPDALYMLLYICNIIVKR